MLSDEEREAKLELNRYIYGKNLSKDEIVDYLGIIFGLIEKQSKEIEELKGIKKFLKKQEIEYIRDRTEDEVNIKWEDKIKAKIEELNDGIKRDMINHDKLKDKSWKLAVHRSIAQKIEIKKVLHSLLEKE